METVRRSEAVFGEEGAWAAVQKRREETRWHREQARIMELSEWKMEKGEEGWSEIREAMDRGEKPKVEMHWETDRYRGKEKAWWTGFAIQYKNRTGESFALHREVGKIPIPEEHEMEDTRMLSLSRTIPMLLVRFYQ